MGVMASDNGKWGEFWLSSTYIWWGVILKLQKYRDQSDCAGGRLQSLQEVSLCLHGHQLEKNDSPGSEEALAS